MNHSVWFLRWGTLLAALGVILGAFAAHALKGNLDEASLSIWQTATRYHLIHALAVVVVGLWLRQQEQVAKVLVLAGWSLLGGVFLFSGSLYALALGGPPWLGPITPLGGLLLIGGWLSLFVAAVKIDK